MLKINSNQNHYTAQENGIINLMSSNKMYRDIVEDINNKYSSSCIYEKIKLDGKNTNTFLLLSDVAIELEGANAKSEASIIG